MSLAREELEIGEFAQKLGGLTNWLALPFNVWELGWIRTCYLTALFDAVVNVGIAVREILIIVSG
jgi:hypothetical protein